MLDSEGNRLAKHIYDPQDTLTRTMRMEYDAVSQLQASLTAQNQATSYTYDDRGNRLTSTDPLSVEKSTMVWTGSSRLYRMSRHRSRDQLCL